MHQEIESLKRQLLEREYHILKMETSVLNHAEQYPNGEWEHLQQELMIWKDKYDRFVCINFETFFYMLFSWIRHQMTCDLQVMVCENVRISAVKVTTK